MSEKQAPTPWDNERVIAEAETIAASYVTLDDDQRRILRTEIIGVLRRQSIDEGWLCENRVQIRDAELTRLREQLAECQQVATALAMLTDDSEWEDVPDGVYDWITLETPDNCRQGIVFYCSDSMGKLKVYAWKPDNWRIQRRKEAHDEA